MARAFGIAATDDRQKAEVVAEHCEAAQYSTVWTNDGAADGIATASWMANATERIRIGIGVVACDRVPAAQLIAKVNEQSLPLDRVVLGVGSGFSPNPVQAVKDAVRALRDAFGTPLIIAVAAMGPKMCAASGEIADVVLLNWMTPERIRWAKSEITKGTVGSDVAPEIASYIRVAVGPGGEQRIESEANRYAAIPHYARHFDAMGIAPGQVGVAGEPLEISAPLAEYEAVLDEAVVRGVPQSDDVESTLEIVRAAAPR